ncbi:MAG: carbonic anhydrase [Acidobacteriaceae bacterium]
MPDSSSSNAILSGSEPAPQSRRSFLCGSAAVVAGVVAAGIAAESAQSFLSPTSVLAQTKLTPDAALKELMDGNRRFVSGQTTAHEHDLTILKQHLAEKQEPYAAVLSCADSRVPVEIVFDQTIGHLFVTRVAGNIITPEIIGSLEYGVAVLGTKAILVLGHSNCGAVKAAVAGKSVPGQISSLYPHIQPAVDEAGHDYKAVTKANAQIQAKLLSQASTVVAGSIKEGQLKVVAGYYDIGSGVVTLLD